MPRYTQNILRWRSRHQEQGDQMGLFKNCQNVAKSFMQNLLYNFSWKKQPKNVGYFGHYLKIASKSQSLNRRKL
jgi:hypothetical protein